MKVVVFGATGGVGKEVLRFAAQAGHEVTAFVRTPEKLPDIPHLTHVVGDAFDADAVAQVIDGADAVISALGSSRGAKKSDELERMAANIASGMVEAGVKRIAYCASAGVEREIEGAPGKIIMWMLRHPLADHREAIERLEAAELDITVARPMSLTDDSFTSDYDEAFGGVPVGGHEVPRASVAYFLVKAIDDPDTYVGTSVGLALPKR